MPLFRTKGRSLAALGAALIMLLLAIDTFLQQVVVFSNRWVLDPIAPEVPRTIQYDPGLPEVYSEGSVLAFDEPEMALVVSKLAYGDGVRPVKYHNGTRPNVDTVCDIPDDCRAA